MIIHLWRKDWLLLRGFVGGFLAVHLLAELLRLMVQDHPAAGEARAALDALPVLVWPLLLVVLVQQDAPAGARQDWLTRPVPRHALLAGKLLFVVLFLLLPVLLMDLAGGLLAQLTIAQAWNDTLARAAFLLFGIALPSMALGALTRSLTQAVVIGIIASAFAQIGGIVVYMATRLAAGTLHVGAMFAILSAGAVVVLALQYFRRDALWPARTVAIVTALAAGALGGVP